MKTFDLEKISKIAIDRPNHQQICAHDHEHREKVIKTLCGMGFQADHDLMDPVYTYLPITVNTREKVFFTAGSVAVMAAAVQCGATVLSYVDFTKLITDYS
ncbi:MAG: hypothetical protein RBQ97_01615 [Acholeplasma sp.]|nr:hypothetical protein [Acholeplasma sp.]